MKGNVEEEVPRPRPLSAGIWTLFSWLRRTDRSSSDESITSVGSDRTTASFDYLSPLHYKRLNSPLVLQQSPLTETYKKRLHDINLRRHYDRDLTLRRKYGLYTEEGLGYDAFSLPPGRRLLKDCSTIQRRQRRATSEIIQPRAAYVPGKRRAPLPPNFVTSASLPRNYKRKRPAPKPPIKIAESNKENIIMNEKIQINNKILLDTLEKSNNMRECQTDKPNKKEHSIKDVKLRTEKSFLKQIFDNKKRNSAIDTSHIKVLPSISELDKQAAEIIETNKINAKSELLTEGSWICTNCLRRYNSTISSCVYCVHRKTRNIKTETNLIGNASNMCTQTEKNDLKSNTENALDEKKKLREMLKEMKNSLPKRPKHNENKFEENKYNITSETETLRIGSVLNEDKKLNNLYSDNLFTRGTESKSQILRDEFLSAQPSTSKQLLPNNLTPIDISEVGQLHGNNNVDLASSSKSISINNINNTLESKRNLKDHLSSRYKQQNISDESKINLGLISQDTPEMRDLKLKDKLEIEIKKNVILSKVDSSDNEKMKIESIDKKIKSDSSTNFKQYKNTHLSSIKENEVLSRSNAKKIENIRLGDVLSPSALQKIEDKTNISKESKKHIDLNTPLKISSLLNPLYLPKYVDSDVKKRVIETEHKGHIQSIITVNIPENNIKSQPNTKKESNITEINDSKKLEERSKQKSELNASTSNPITSSTNSYLDHHAQRRDLINQLEQSIAKGDEQTAALAAAKLAKFKLACSVLSFSSQIVSGPLLSRSVENDHSKVLSRTDSTAAQTDFNVITNKEIKSKNNIHKEEKPETPKLINKNLNIDTKSINERPKTSKIKVEDPIPSTSKQVPVENIPIDVWIEDKEATRGPILLLVSRKSTVGDLKKQAEKSLGLQIRLQRWIIGKTLCSDDNLQLVALAGPDLTAPFYLYLVESDTNKATGENEKEGSNIIEVTRKDVTDVYSELMKLEQLALVPNTEEFECGVCIERCTVGQGVVLRECIHSFCRECLADVVRHCQEPIVSCPAIACPGALQEREIRALLTPEDYEKWLARSLAAAESGTRNTFHCQTRDCTGWAFCEPGVRRFPCPVCKHTNCVQCQAVHEGQTCELYQAKLREAVSAVETDQTDSGTQALLKSLIERGEALECPECKAIITKKWGCDWIKCSACKTEICWVTKGRRWGPGGKGDTSGGCRCGVDGKRCHPSCAYCH